MLIRHCMFLIVVPFLLLTACGTYEYRKRPPDNSEVAVIRNIDNVFPEFARSYLLALDGLKLPQELADISLGHGELRSQITEFFKKRDQLNAQLRDFVLARYQSYVNSELDPHPQARIKGRDDWNAAMKEVQLRALQIRDKVGSIAQQVDERKVTKRKVEEARKKKAFAQQTLDEVSKTHPKDKPEAYYKDPWDLEGVGRAAAGDIMLADAQLRKFESREVQIQEELKELIPQANKILAQISQDLAQSN